MKKGKDGFYARYIKRIIDFTISLVALTFLSPIMIILIIVGAFAMKGNPFFVQERPGKIDNKTGKERIFKLIKFRTMTNEKDENGNLLPDSQRMNRYGWFLRATSLDELPGLLNVLNGTMSVCGPRPLLISYLDYYTEEERHRHDIRPGITGWAQVNGRNNLSWEKRFQYDVEYVRNVSFSFDIKILFLSVKKVLCHSDVAEDTSKSEGNFAEIRRAQIEMAKQEITKAV